MKKTKYILFGRENRFMKQQGGAAYGNPALEDPTGSVYRAVCSEELTN